MLPAPEHQALADLANADAHTDRPDNKPSLAFQVLQRIRGTGADISPDTARSVSEKVAAIRADLTMDDEARGEALRQVVRDHLPTEDHADVPAASTFENVVGDKLDSRRTAFHPDSGTLGIPRADMPQVAAEHRGALANFFQARGIDWQNEDVLPGSLKPSQADFNPAKVKKAAEWAGGSDRRILVSSDDHVIDGHHQWLGRLQAHPDEPMPVVRLNAPARDILGQVHEFPSAKMQKAPDLDANGNPIPLTKDSAGTELSAEDRVRLTDKNGKATEGTLAKVQPDGGVRVKFPNGVAQDYPRSEIESRPDRMVKLAPEPVAPQPLTPPATRQPNTGAGKEAVKVIERLTNRQRQSNGFLDPRARDALVSAREILDKDLNRQVLGANPQPITERGKQSQAAIQALEEAKAAGARLTPGEHRAWTNHVKTLENDFTKQRQALDARRAAPPAPSNAALAPTFKARQEVIYQGRRGVIESIDGDKAVVRLLASQDPKTGVNLRPVRKLNVPLSALTAREGSAQTVDPASVAPVTREKAVATADTQYRANRVLLRAMGITDRQFTKLNTGGGVSFGEDGILRIDPDRLAESMTTVAKNQQMLGLGNTPEDWFLHVLDEEGTHGVGNVLAKEANQTPEQFYESVPDDAYPPDWQENGRASYGAKSWDALPKWKQKAEFVRMTLQGKYLGKITEALYRFIQPFVDYFNRLAKLDGLDPRLKGFLEKYSARLEAVRGGNAVAKPEFRSGGRATYGRRAATIQAIEGDTATIQVKGSKTPVQVPVAELKPPVSRRFVLPSTVTGAPDVIDHVAENGGMRGSVAGQRIAKGKGADYDDRPNLKGVYQNAVFGGSMGPDQMASLLHEDYGVGDGTVGTMYGEIDRAMQSRQSGRAETERQATVEKQAGRFDKDALQEGTAKGKTEVNARDLNVGDKVQVGNQTITVKDVDPDTLDVTLEDHTKYGLQRVEGGQKLYVEKVEPGSAGDDSTLAAARPDRETSSLFPEDEPFDLRGELASPAERVAAARELATRQAAASAAPTAPPTLRPGERQGDLLSRQSEDLKLVGEQGVDHGARQEAARRNEADRAVQDQQQGALFAAKPESSEPTQTFPPDLLKGVDPTSRRADLLREHYANGELSQSRGKGLWSLGAKTARNARELVTPFTTRTLAERRATLDADKEKVRRGYADAGQPVPKNPLAEREAALATREAALAKFQPRDADTLAAAKPEEQPEPSVPQRILTPAKEGESVLRTSAREWLADERQAGRQPTWADISSQRRVSKDFAQGLVAEQHAAEEAAASAAPPARPSDTPAPAEQQAPAATAETEASPASNEPAFEQSVDPTRVGTIKDLVDETMGPDAPNRRRFVQYGTIEPAQAAQIKADTGLDLEGYRRNIDASAVRHVLKNHGDPAAELARGNAPLHKEDFERLPELLEKPDASVYAGKNRQGQDVILSAKRVNGYYIVAEEAREGRRSLNLVTFYKKSAPPLADDALPVGTAPSLTPEAIQSAARQTLQRLVGQRNVETAPVAPTPKAALDGLAVGDKIDVTGRGKDHLLTLKEDRGEKVVVSSPGGKDITVTRSLALKKKVTPAIGGHARSTDNDLAAAQPEDESDSILDEEPPATKAPLPKKYTVAWAKAKLAEQRGESALADTLSAHHDAVPTMADGAGRHAKMGVGLDLPDDLDDRAAGPLAEAGYDPKVLAADLAKVQASPDKKLAAKYAPAYQHALDNAPRLTQAAEGWRQRQLAEDAAAERAGLPPSWKTRIRHFMDDPLSPESTIAPAEGFGATKGFKKGADAIAAGVDPKTTALSDHAERYVIRNRQTINEHAFQAALADMKASDGKPMVSSIEESSSKMNPDGTLSTSAKVPRGYQAVQAGNNIIVAHDEIAPLLEALYGSSKVRENWLGNFLLNLAAVTKHGAIGIDSYHGFQAAIRSVLGFQVADYRNGLVGRDYADADLDRAVKAGKISQADADDARKYRAIDDGLVREGMNIGKVGDNLLDVARQHNLVASIPVLGYAATWVNNKTFHEVQPGYMRLAGRVAYERNKARYPSLSEQELLRRSAREVNEFYGNLGSQGVFKSKTMQDLSKLTFFAPGFAEGRFRTETRGIGQAAGAVADGLRGRGWRVGVVAQAMSGIILASLIGNQALNLFTRGKPTWENEEEGHKFDAWLPGGAHGKGFFFSPLAIAAEYSHALTKYLEHRESAVDALAHVVGNKLSGGTRAVKTLVSGTDYKGQPFASLGERLKAAALEMLPLPMQASPWVDKDPKGMLGLKFNHAKGSLEKQLLATVGLRVDPADSARSQMFALAQKFRGDQPAEQHGPSAYAALRTALDNEDAASARTEVMRLVTEGHKTLDQIADKAAGLKAGKVHPEFFTGSREKDLAMIAQMTPAQKKVYVQAFKDRQANAAMLSHTLASLPSTEMTKLRLASLSNRRGNASAAAQVGKGSPPMAAAIVP